MNRIVVGSLLAAWLVVAPLGVPPSAQQTPESARAEPEVRVLFERFVTIQNAHDLGGLRELLWDSPRFLWITRGTPIWGHEAALKRFEGLYQGTWRLEPEMAELRVTLLREDVAQLYVPVVFTIGAAGQAAQPTRFLMNQTIVKTPAGWKIANILPIPAPAP